MRTMLSGREDLIAPHPPHIMRDFMPILSKYGDLDLNSNLKVSKTQEEAVEEKPATWMYIFDGTATKQTTKLLQNWSY